MIHDLMLRWVVTGLFALSAAECVAAIATTRRPWTLVVHHGLHLVMAVAMAVMAWPRGAQLQPTGPAVFFLLAAVWFVAMAIVASATTAGRGVYVYHALMMLASSWMYAIMSDHLLPLLSSTQHAPATTTSIPTMDEAAMNMPATSASPIWFSTVNWFGAVGLAAAAVFWACLYLIGQPHEGTRSRSLGNLGQATMAAGMAILFFATLLRI
ncbi:hypothetical protein MSS4_03729 [Mycobacterium marinum]|uniref:Conserved hypothetical membrane protein n=1 Tax=Mycobacterium marinum (strain ATCC BAA-535 / M) TaxID=216594 RepID=B2HFP5_MYCMM|nr:DUF5134 domain-containing protein [Mycobacterium marinum]ACC39890.1 conserved hypothetical membrane protein [Mycobacterium marinum M]RFZ45862.1 hypothetical protein MSS4_03729 [Mycobacterium marinum]